MEALLAQINSGHATEALTELGQLLEQLAGNPRPARAKGRGLALFPTLAEAVEAFRHGRKGAGARNWLAGRRRLLAAMRTTDDAVCPLKAQRGGTSDNDEESRTR